MLVLSNPNTGEAIGACIVHATGLDQALTSRGMRPRFKTNFLEVLWYLNAYGCQIGNELNLQRSKVLMAPDGQLNFSLAFCLNGDEQPFMVGGLCYHGPMQWAALANPDILILDHWGWSVNT
jgi:hypothetical protein